MKIKETSIATGLSKKTIRHYEEWGLVVPLKSESNGRAFRDYSQKDVEELKNIAVLRKAHFSIDQIRMMQEYPEDIPDIVEKFRAELEDEGARINELINQFRELDPEKLQSVAELSRQIGSSASKLPLPTADIRLNFGRFDSESESEKKQMYAEHEKNWEKTERFRRVFSVWEFLLTTAAVVLIIASVAGVIYVLGSKVSFIRQINITLDAVEWNQNDTEYCRPCNIKISGSCRDYLFSQDRFDGDFVISTDSYSKKHSTTIWKTKTGYSTCMIGSAEAYMIVHSKDFSELFIICEDGGMITANADNREEAVQETSRLTQKYLPDG